MMKKNIKPQKIKIQLTKEGKKVFIWNSKLKLYVLCNKQL